MSKKVLITGSSAGFGKLIADTLIAKGHTVIASMRDPQGRNGTISSELKGKGAHVVEIDVTNDTSVSAGVTRAIEMANGVDVVINNAGVGVLGLQEMFTPDDWKRLFDINVFGVQRVNRAVLPHMRERGNGLLIHISSLLGRMVLPFMGPYNSSKFALEAMAENFRVELSGMGIESIIIEPGGFGTTFQDRLMEPSDTTQRTSYGPMADAPQAFFSGFEKNLSSPNAPNPQMVADAVLRVIEMPAGTRPFRTVVDGLGMGTHIEKMNDLHEQINNGVYNAFGMGGMLSVKK